MIGPGFNYEQYGSAFLDMRLHKLRVLITAQSDVFFEEYGVVAPSACLSVMLFLDEHRHTNNTQMAEGLGYSHQLINLRIGMLEKRGLIERFRDPRDHRRKLIALTRKGKADAARIKTVMPVVADVIDGVFRETDVDLLQSVGVVDQALREKSLQDRVNAPSRSRVKRTA